MKKGRSSSFFAVLMTILLAVPATGLLVMATPKPQASTKEQILALMTEVNAQLEASGQDMRVDYVEYITPDDSGEVAQTVFFNDRGNKQLSSHFVPGDPRRGGRTNITYMVDQTEGAIDGLTVAATTAAIDRAMSTWNSQSCSVIPIIKLAAPAVDLGVVEFLNGLGGQPNFLADITHAGWLPSGILPNNVIAATFTFIWVSGGAPTDINNDGKTDTAFREILYNNRFLWRINANTDVETIALHEAGHGLSQAHFGIAFVTNSNGKLHFSPLAVMNAAYSGLQQGPAGTDNAGHCSIWASWPSK